MSKQEEEKKNREARKQRLLKCVAEITPIIRQSMESNSIECCSGEFDLHLIRVSVVFGFLVHQVYIVWLWAFMRIFL